MDIPRDNKELLDMIIEEYKSMLYYSGGGKMRDSVLQVLLVAIQARALMDIAEK
jgi:hypothetical protein